MYFDKMFVLVKTGSVVMFLLLSFYGAMGKQESVHCEFEGALYEEGEIWAFQTCTRCTCGKEGKVSCQSQRCSRMQCENQQVVPGQCCPVCMDNLPPVMETPLVPPPSGPCVHADILRHHGEVFPSTSSGLRPTSHNQCVLCYCIDTDVLCHLKTCPITRCRHPILKENDCCKTCPDVDVEESAGDIVEIKMISSTQPPRPTNQQQVINPSQDCHFGGEVYKNSTRWHPVVATFGRMDCVFCQCLNAHITCERMKCPHDEELPCKEPAPSPGQCCKSCLHQAGTKTNSSRKGSDVLLKFMKSTSGLSSGEISETSPLPAPHQCPGRSTEVLVYSQQTRLKYVLVFHHMQKKRLEKLTWTLDSGQITDYRRAERNVETFQQFRDYKLLGGTRWRRFIRFKQRMKRLMEKCQPSCSRKLLHRQVRRLRVKEVNYRDTC